MGVIYSDTSNPFGTVTESTSGEIFAESSSGLKIQLDVNTPSKLKLMEK
ncbi:hypothetical protein [Listeria ivanovii]|nr:hypothetical protein [Listeria ivanovii]MBK2002296.1 hypothetical protein [Listeria ivanovii subsp. londoniensis]